MGVMVCLTPKTHRRGGRSRLKPLAGTVSRVVLLGPAHTVALGAIAAPHAEAFDGPLGPLTVDRPAL